MTKTVADSLVDDAIAVEWERPTRSRPVAFVSGHLDLSEFEFMMHYAPVIDTYFAQGFDFVVGDARGCDARAQDYLSRIGANVTVYHMFDSPRNNVGAHQTRGGIGCFTSDSARDKAMTEDSDVDVAWVRPGREDSGTFRNIVRRWMQLDAELG
jgi:hypothetical protein